MGGEGQHQGRICCSLCFSDAPSPSPETPLSQLLSETPPLPGLNAAEQKMGWGGAGSRCSCPVRGATDCPIRYHEDVLDGPRVGTVPGERVEAAPPSPGAQLPPEMELWSEMPCRWS